MKKAKFEDGSQKGGKWITDVKYVGEWKNNQKCGFGIQYHSNGDRYEGGWENNMRNQQGTLWVFEGKKKLRRAYTGDWVNDKKTGRGTMFYKNEDRYDGMWLNDHQHGSGRMIFANGDVFEGFFHMGKRSGYGVLTKRNGDHFEGHWVNDKREGQGSYFFAEKNKVFVGEWVNDLPKSGVYSDVEDPDNPQPARELHHTDPYRLPALPNIKLKNPTEVLRQAMEQVRQERTFYRATFIPIFELYNEDELRDLTTQFSSAVDEATGTINMVNLNAVLNSMNFELSDEEIDSYLLKINQKYDAQNIDFELFARLVAILLEEANNLNRENVLNAGGEVEEDDDNQDIDGDGGDNYQEEDQDQHQHQYQDEEEGGQYFDQGEYYIGEDGQQYQLDRNQLEDVDGEIMDIDDQDDQDGIYSEGQNVKSNNSQIESLNQSSQK